MPRFSYPNFPFPFYKNYSRNPTYSHNFSLSQTSHTSNYGKNNFQNNSSIKSDITSYSKNVSQHINLDEDKNCRNFEEKNKSNKNNNDYLFDLFGLKIYSDDVLLVSLIYFLYSEGVRDDSLFLALILLLIS